MKLTALILIGLLFFNNSSTAQQKKLTTAGAPAWITTSNLKKPNQQLLEQAEDGAIILIYERQVNVEEKQSYYRTATKILSEAGVQENSKVEISFDPEYQQLVFHSIHVIREGLTINKLNLSKIKLVQQENELNRHLYNGTQTAIIILDDIRNGDIVEYTYSIVGRNPIFQNKYAGVFDMQFSVPVGQLSYSLILSRNRKAQIKNIGTSLAPATKSSGANNIYKWHSENVSALKIPDGVPYWFEAYPTIMISEYASWGEVNNWALNLYKYNAANAAKVRQLAAQIKKDYTTPERQAAAALKFVQDEIRYMGIEVGQHSHLPHHPEQVIIQRYGDCKDKALLLCTLLNILGIKASPVLINTEYKKTIKNWLPSPYAFDHVTVQVQLNEKTYYFDPTISNQRGEIDQISFPDYQVGLVVREGTNTLTDIELQDKGKVQVKEEFFIKNMTGTASLTVTTNYTGSFADDIRSRYKSESLPEIRKGYLEFYQSYFKDIKGLELSYKDDVTTGTFSTIERYAISKIWGKDNLNKKASFEPYVISNIIKRPKEELRNYPLYISYPSNYEEEILIYLPENWEIDKEEFITEAHGFKFTNSYSCTGKKVRLSYTYKTTKDHVTPGELNEYVSAVAKADDNIAYSLSSFFGSDAVADTPISILSGNYTSIYILLGLCVFITFLVKNRRS